MPARSFALAALSAIACTTDPPATPRFQEDVLPILAANCVRCHAVPSIGGAPGASDCAAPSGGVRWCGHRLDSYDDTIVDDGDPADPDDDIGVRGAAFMSLLLPIAHRDPPLRFPLDDAERDTIITWAKGDPPDRTPRPDNQLPTIAVTAGVPTASAVTLGYQLDDGDRDLTVGTLRARGPGGDLLVAPIQSGRDELSWSLVGVVAGSYTLVARVDDGAGWIELPAGSLEVAP